MPPYPCLAFLLDTPVRPGVVVTFRCTRPAGHVPVDGHADEGAGRVWTSGEDVVWAAGAVYPAREEGVRALRRRPRPAPEPEVAPEPVVSVRSTGRQAVVGAADPRVPGERARHAAAGDWPPPTPYGTVTPVPGSAEELT